jgi:hypothetical protein
MRVAAWRVRMLLEFNRGNVDAARRCQRRAELLQLHDGGEVRYPGSSAAVEMHAYSNAHDLLGVKSTLDPLADLAQQFSGWRPVSLLAQGRYRQLQGDVQGALELIESGLLLALPGQHAAFQPLASAHITLLAELDRLDEAVRRGRAYLDDCEREQLTARGMLLKRDFAAVLAQAGQHREALELIDAAVAFAEKHPGGGLALGLFYEKRAEVAMHMGDPAEFMRAFERCATEYRKGQNPMLSAKLARLLDRARQLGCETGEPARELLAWLTPADHETEHNTVRSRMLECIDADDRARCALTILLQSAESCSGYLYGVRESDVVALCALPEPSSDAALTAWLQRQVLDEIAAAANDGADDESRSQRMPERFTDAEGRTFGAVLLIGEHEGQQRIAGALVLDAPSEDYRVPPRNVMFEIASRLLEHGDVIGAVLAVTSITAQS